MGIKSIASCFKSFEDYQEMVLLSLYSATIDLTSWERERETDGSLDSLLEYLAKGRAIGIVKLLAECGVLHHFELANYATMNRFSIVADFMKAHEMLSLKWFNEDRPFSPALIESNVTPPLRSMLERVQAKLERDPEPIKIGKTPAEEHYTAPMAKADVAELLGIDIGTLARRIKRGEVRVIDATYRTIRIHKADIGK